MYINSDYKDAYLNYIRNLDYSANTVRNLRSDVNSFFIWLEAFNEDISIDKLYFEYQRYLIISKTPTSTISRKLSTLSKFISWLNVEHPSLSASTTPINRTERQNNLYLKRVHKKYQGKFWIISKLFIAFTVFLVLIIGILGIYRSQITANNTKRVDFETSYSPQKEYSIQFDLFFHSINKSTYKPNSILTFKFYLQNSQNHSIGYVVCPFSNPVNLGGSLRLKIVINSKCTSIPSEVHNTIARNEAIFTDIYVNDQKITLSRVLLNNQLMTKAELNYHEKANSSITKAGKIGDILPNSPFGGDVLGSEIASSGASLLQSVPLSIFQDKPNLDDGDIVTIYNNEVIRALLSTKIFGIKSGDRIITQGVGYVHVIDTPSSPIIVGDYVSTSTTPGYGQKALSKYDSIVGVALEPYTPGNAFIKVLITNN